MLVFDLIANPDLIQPPYGFYAVFLEAGFILAAITVLAFRLHWRRRNHLCIFASIWIIGAGTLLFLDARDVFRVQDMVRRGHYSTLEGCVASFRPGSPTGSKTTSGDERWTLAAREFSYGQGQAMPYYHTVEGGGGLVHPTSRLSVSFVISPYDGDEKIVRLQTLEPACQASAAQG
jgi:hypothetical protein